MKTNLLFTFILAISCLIVHAQGETKIGIKAGLTSANVYGPDVAQLSNNGAASTLQGFNVGVFVNSKISRHFWLKSEVLTIQKGAALQIKSPAGLAFKSNLKSQYIDVYPASPTFHWKGFQALAGPYVSMLLSSSQQDSVGNTNSAVFGVSSSLSAYRQKLDAGIAVGAEYEFKFGISVGCRFTHGFVPLFENPGYIVTNPTSSPQLHQKIYNESFSVSLGYSLGKNQSARPKK